MSGLPEWPRALALSAATILAASTGCTDRITDPGPVRAGSPNLQAEAVVPGETPASVQWSAITRDFIAAKPAAEKPNQQVAFRAFAYLSLAQYRAVIAAHDARGGPRHAPSRGAVSAASAVVLGALFPEGAAFFDSELRAQERDIAGPPNAQHAFAAGEAIGRTVGTQVIELARTDGFDVVWTGTVPTGPGLWSSDFDPPRPPLHPVALPNISAMIDGIGTPRAKACPCSR